jgi:hypothetical protein
VIVTPLLQIVDRLISLVKERRAVDRDIFVQLIEPLFARFEPAAENYILVFERLGKDAADSETDEALVRAFKRFRQDRIEFHPTRQAVTALAHEYSESKVNRDLSSFFRDLEGFFYNVGSEESMSRQIEDQLMHLMHSRPAEKQLLEAVHNGVDWGPQIGDIGVSWPGRAIDPSAFLAHGRRTSGAEIHRLHLELVRGQSVGAVHPVVLELTNRWKKLQSDFARLRIRYVFPDRLTKI